MLGYAVLLGVGLGISQAMPDAVTTGALVAVMGKYPGYPGTANPVGSIQAIQTYNCLNFSSADGSCTTKEIAGIRLKSTGASRVEGLLPGCDVDSGCGIHIHDGFTCDTASLVG